MMMMDSEQLKALEAENAELRTVLTAGDTMIIYGTDYRKLLTILRDELGVEDVGNTPLAVMLDSLQAALVNGRRWRNALEWYADDKVYRQIILDRFDFSCPILEDGGERAREAMRKPLSAAAIAWGEKRAKEITDSAGSEGYDYE